MDRIQKAGTKFERIGQEEEETTFIPNNSVNHIYFIFRDTFCQIKVTTWLQIDVQN